MKKHESPELGRSVSCLMELSLTLHHVNRTLEARCGLSVVQWSLLKTLLNMPAVSPLVLARALGVTPVTLSQSLTRLERKKYLFMCDDPSDARKRMVSLTRLGRNKLEDVDRAYELVFAEIETLDGGVQRIGEYLKNKVKLRLNQIEII